MIRYVLGSNLCSTCGKNAKMGIESLIGVIQFSQNNGPGKKSEIDARNEPLQVCGIADHSPLARHVLFFSPLAWSLHDNFATQLYVRVSPSKSPCPLGPVAFVIVGGSLVQIPFEANRIE